MTITQTVEIPENRQVFLDLPLTLPVGKALVTIVSQMDGDSKSPERIGFLKGQGKIPADFDTMGQKEITSLFEGEY